MKAVALTVATDCYQSHCNDATTISHLQVHKTIAGSSKIFWLYLQCYAWMYTVQLYHELKWTVKLIPNSITVKCNIVAHYSAPEAAQDANKQQNEANNQPFPSWPHSKLPQSSHFKEIYLKQRPCIHDVNYTLWFHTEQDVLIHDQIFREWVKYLETQQDTLRLNCISSH